mmetsp:Transcript_52666/g.163437  ORF Transcript_52666/g.163437 Transcript_52666/m.163437 type:complete len:580 (-) Transcript_52666:67-1806(-)
MAAAAKKKGGGKEGPSKHEQDKERLTLALKWSWSYEVDEMFKESFGIDDDWTQRIFFEAEPMSHEELEAHPDPLLLPPRIDNGAGKPFRVNVHTVGGETARRAGYLIISSKRHPLKLRKANRFEDEGESLHGTMSSVVLDQKATKRSPASVWAVENEESDPATIYGKILFASKKRMNPCHEHLYRTESTNQDEDEETRPKDEELNQVCPNPSGGQGGKSYWDWKHIQNSPLATENTVQVVDKLRDQSEKAAHDVLQQELSRRKGQGKTILKSWLRAVEMAELKAVNISNSKIQRWGSEYDQRVLPNAKFKTFSMLAEELQPIWAAEEEEVLVTIYNAKPGDKVRISSLCRSDAYLAQYVDKEGTLLSRDAHFDCWWADFGSVEKRQRGIARKVSENKSTSGQGKKVGIVQPPPSTTEARQGALFCAGYKDAFWLSHVHPPQETHGKSVDRKDDQINKKLIHELNVGSRIRKLRPNKLLSKLRRPRPQRQSLFDTSAVDPRQEFLDSSYEFFSTFTDADQDDENLLRAIQEQDSTSRETKLSHIVKLLSKRSEMTSVLLDTFDDLDDEQEFEDAYPGVWR